jgi:hypothetical protein
MYSSALSESSFSISAAAATNRKRKLHRSTVNLLPCSRRSWWWFIVDMVIKICFSKKDDGKDIIGRWIF